MVSPPYHGVASGLRPSFRTWDCWTSTWPSAWPREAGARDASVQMWFLRGHWGSYPEDGWTTSGWWWLEHLHIFPYIYICIYWELLGIILPVDWYFSEGLKAPIYIYVYIWLCDDAFTSIISDVHVITYYFDFADRVEFDVQLRSGLEMKSISCTSIARKYSSNMQLSNSWLASDLIQIVFPYLSWCIYIVYHYQKHHQIKHHQIASLSLSFSYHYL